MRLKIVVLALSLSANMSAFAQGNYFLTLPSVRGGSEGRNSTERPVVVNTQYLPKVNPCAQPNPPRTCARPNPRH